MFDFIKKYRAKSKLTCGVRYGEAGKFKESLQCFDEILEIFPDCLIAIEFKGIVFEKMKNYDSAIKCYELATDIDSSNTSSWYGKGRLLSFLGRYEEAIQWYDKGLQLNKNNLGILLGKAHLYGDYEEFDKELECIGYMLKIDPEYETGLHMKGNNLLSQKKYKLAFDAFSQLVKLYPKNEYGWAGMAGTSGEMGNFEDASKYIVKAIKLNKKSFDRSDYLYLYSSYLKELGCYEDALKMIDKSLDLFSKEEENYGITKNFYLKGKILINLNKVNEAEENFNLALDNALKSIKWALDNKGDERAYDHYYVAKLFECLNRTNEAIEYYEKALKLDPECLKAKNSLELLKS